MLCACLLLSGCGGLPSAREMGDMALLRTMSVDNIEGAGVEVTVSTGPRARGLQGEAEPSLVLSARDRSLSGACLAIQGLSDSYVFYGYVDQLLLGETVARTSVRPALDYFARDVEVGLGTQLWLVQGANARQAVESGGERGVDDRLSTLQADGKLGVALISRTAGEVYTDLTERGAAFVPALVVDEDGSMLYESGYGVLKEDRLVGFLEGEMARGLEILDGRASAEVLTADLNGNQVSMRITSVYVKPALEFRGSLPERLKISCRVEAVLTEYQEALEAEELDQAQEILKQQIQKRLEQVLSLLQQWQTDCIGLGLRASAAHPVRWRQIQGEWPDCFEGIETEIDLQAVVHK